MQDFEKLGVFYLGRQYDLKEKKLKDGLLLYDAKDLVTHAVIVGMTGSGKTGLGIDLIEEAVLDGVPVIAIDPKGDMGNLLLTFPQLSGEDFLPWINEDDARQAGVSAAGVCRPAGGDLEERAGRLGPERGPDRAAAQRRRVCDLYPRQQRRRADLDPEIVRCAGAGDRRGQ